MAFEQPKDIWGPTPEEETAQGVGILEKGAEEAEKEKSRETGKKIMERGVQEGIIEEAAKTSGAVQEAERQRAARAEQLRKELLGGEGEEDIWEKAVREAKKEEE